MSLWKERFSNFSFLKNAILEFRSKMLIVSILKDSSNETYVSSQNMISTKIVITNFCLTPRVTRVPFRDVAILTAFFAHSRYSESLDQKFDWWNQILSMMSLDAVRITYSISDDYLFNFRITYSDISLLTDAGVCVA